MQNLVLGFLLLLSLTAKANMAEPGVRGTMGASPFTSTYVDILKEDLRMKINRDFTKARVSVTYLIKSDSIGKQIPMLFYASDFLDDFQVMLDGKIVQHYGGDWNSQISELPVGFDYFEVTSNGRRSVEIDENEQSGLMVELYDLLYFELDLDSGFHKIEVTYTSQQWIDAASDVNVYSFRYNLSPVKNWRSFNTLNFILDISECALNWDDLLINLPSNVQADSLRIKSWIFEDIPVDTIMLEYKPVVSPYAKFFIKLGTFWFALILMIPLIILQQTFCVKSWKNKGKYANSISLTFILIIPLIFVIFWTYCYDWIDLIIGEHANANNGYGQVLVFITYPFWLGINFVFTGLWYQWTLYRKKSKFTL